jgi:hypothetical protein
MGTDQEGTLACLEALMFCRRSKGVGVSQDFAEAIICFEAVKTM